MKLRSHVKTGRQTLIEAVRLFNTGDNKEVIKSLLVLSEEGYLLFSRMMLKGLVHYEEGGKMKSMNVRKTKRGTYFNFKNMDHYLINEDFYGGTPQAKLPEFVQLATDEDETIASYLGIDEELL